MGDLFHADVPAPALDHVVRAMIENPRHTYMIITKRPQRMADWIASLAPESMQQLQKMLWLGVSAENQSAADERLPHLARNWPGLRLACVEPLLESVDVTPWLTGDRRLHWVVCGGETGAGGQAADPNDVRMLKDACVKARVPFFLKSFGGPNKKLAGRTLDGRTWDQIPG